MLFVNTANEFGIRFGVSVNKTTCQNGTVPILKRICKPYSNFFLLEISKRKSLLEENQTFEDKGKIIRTYGLMPRNIDFFFTKQKQRISTEQFKILQ